MSQGRNRAVSGLARELLKIGLIQPGGNSLEFHVLPIPAVGVLQVLQILQLGSTVSSALRNRSNASFGGVM